MRRIIHNTTAIIACLSLLTPNLALAETRIPDGQAQKQMQKRAENQPRRAAALQAELAGGLTVKHLSCADGSSRPCADGVALVTPGGLAVDISESGQIYLAAGGAQKQAKAATKQAEAAADALAAALAQQDEKNEKPGKDKDKPEQARNNNGKNNRDNQRTEKPQQTEHREDIVLATSDTAMERADKMNRLYRVLQQEVDGGLQPQQLQCLSGAGYPCADGERMMTPRGVVLEQLDNGEYRLASTANQMYRVNAKGDLVERAAEEGLTETQAAKEAAAGIPARRAAALDQGDQMGKIIEQMITQDNTRRSDQDFATNLRDALAASDGQKQEKKDDGDNSDLTKALALGLGALAVGAMLNNNRQVALSAPDRMVVTRPDGSQEVIKDETALLRQPGSTVTTENFDDGSSRTIVTRPDGSKVVTIRDADLTVLRRTLVRPDGSTTELIDDTVGVEPVDITRLPEPAPVQTVSGTLTEDQLRAALQRETAIDRRFSLSQVRNIPEVRALVAPVNIDAITFDTGSAAITPDQAQQLATLGTVIQDAVSENPREMFLIEGHTDTVGSEAMNLALSDRRAESVALALSEYFQVPPENLVVQGYGEQFLKIREDGDIRQNRRASVRRITDLLRTAAAN
ncbi:OmpA family protein [Paracoccus sp. (in: a-proteobacteria)]|uniref:OmpA family protein n=1 Tax=Paracoccus sp. TaxID=267 RepID=UPI003A899338